MKRSDCVFGLHFDFHAGNQTKGIGTLTDGEKLGKYLDEIKA